MTYKPLCCWDCGVQIIVGEQGHYVFTPSFSQVKFGLSDGSYCESPFCTACAEKEWTWERAKAFEAAVNRVSSQHQITVVAVEGRTLPTGAILAILDPAQASQANRR